MNEPKKRETMNKIVSSDITPEYIYLNRRKFLKSMGVLSASAAALSACLPATTPVATPEAAPTADETTPTASASADELGDPLNSFDEITNFNNFYEFSTNKQAVARLASGFVTAPWTVEVGGLVNKPLTLDFDDIRSQFDQEERIYRLRCVEGWSMVIPWVGFPLAKLLALAEPKSEAQYVRFETLMDPEQMPGQKSPWYSWPYVEGLRMDEAMHDLAILSTGIYGKNLLPQNGAPIRLVVPWKYGFKSIKSIVRIDLVEEQPVSLWMQAAPHEYGFYANVNPEVDHPRWSQSSELRIGEISRRPTLMFNGYAEQVAELYAGMDLGVNY